MDKSGSLFTKESYYIQYENEKNCPNKRVKSTGASVENDNGNSHDLGVQFDGDHTSSVAIFWKMTSKTER